MKKAERRDKDPGITIELPVVPTRNHHTKPKDPKRIVFPFVSRVGIILALILSAVLIVHAIYTHVINRPVSLIDTTTPVFTGNNGNGTADASFHPELSALQELQERSDAKEMKELIRSISCSFDTSSNLSNRMSVTYACSYNTDLSDKLDVSFKDTSKSYTVMGLADAEALDPFEIFDVEYAQNEDGYSLELVPDASYTDLGINYSYTYVNDHSIKVTVDYDEDSLYASGYYISKDHCEKIMDIPCLSDMDQISEDNLEKIENTLLTKTLNELYACDNNLTFGKEILSTFHPEFESFQKNDDGTYDAVITVNNIYSLTLSKYYHFTIKYHGIFIRDTDGTVTFLTEDQHGCTYDGFGSEYEIQKATSE